MLQQPLEDRVLQYILQLHAVTSNNKLCSIIKELKDEIATLKVDRENIRPRGNQ